MAAGQPAAALPSWAGAPSPPRLPLCRARISRSAVPLAELASCLSAPGPVPVQGVAMISQRLANGAGPLYCEHGRDDLDGIIEAATQALTG